MSNNKKENIEQSYNHFFPQALMKHGWGEADNPVCLNLENLREIFRNETELTLEELLSLSQVDQSPLILEVVPTIEYFGNRIIKNSTEDYIARIFGKIHITEAIEDRILTIAKAKTLKGFNLEFLYRWLTLQRIRVPILLTQIIYRQDPTYSFLESSSKYTDFKNKFNDLIIDCFSDLDQKSKKMKVEIFNKGHTDSDIDLVLSDYNTVPIVLFENLFLDNEKVIVEKEGQKKFDAMKAYFKSPEAYISIISSNRFMLFYEDIWKNKEEIKTLINIISNLWMTFQLSYGIKYIILFKDEEKNKKILSYLHNQKDMFLKIEKAREKENKQYLLLVEKSNEFEREIKELANKNAVLTINTEIVKITTKEKESILRSVFKKISKLLSLIIKR